MQRIAITLSLCLISGLSLAAPLKGAVSSPETGILSDKVDSAHTKALFGK